MTNPQLHTNSALAGRNWVEFQWFHINFASYFFMFTDRLLEFITNLMHNFIYSIIILHHDPQYVSSIAVLIFRRTIVHLQYLVSSHSVCCHPVHRLRADCSPLLIGALDGSIQCVTIPDTVNIQLSSWRWAQRCSKHIEDHYVILLLNK
jgi:hypothetical protein